MTLPLTIPLTIKVCGLTRVEDACRAAELGADLLGLNFAAGSPRRVSVETALQIAAAVAGSARLVGVFVDQERREVEEIAAAVGLDLLQFHGSEEPAALAPFGRRAIKVFRLPPGGGEVPLQATALAAYADAWGFLFDAPAAGAHGGSGRPWRYGAVAGLPRDRPMLIAGGLGPANVRDALRESGATGVDVCSGVESAPGIKDHALLARFLGAARKGAESSGGRE
jgi:phosphoribosylanthranilate isomerase